MDTFGNVLDEAEVFCWKEATAARETPSAERRGGEEARRKAVENSLAAAAGAFERFNSG